MQYTCGEGKGIHSIQIEENEGKSYVCVLELSNAYGDDIPGGLKVLSMQDGTEMACYNPVSYTHLITGSGGFTNISSNSKKAVFCGTFTNGVKIHTGDGKLTILEEGKKHKFVKKVTEITFSGVVAGKAGKDVLYVTERAVFALKADGIHLIEVAPGIDAVSYTHL